MDESRDSKPATMNNDTTVERKSEREIVVTRSFNAPPHLVFEAWTRPELFKQWWAPKSMGMPIISCEMDVRVGGSYRIEFRHPAFEQPIPFFGRYLEVTPNTRLVWTNEESPAGAVTTVTFGEKEGKTQLVLHERYPTKEALDESIGGTEGMPEQFGQLDELLVTTGKGVLLVPVPDPVELAGIAKGAKAKGFRDRNDRV